ncbi:MAG: hypothetical protein KatS3mg085_705 [Candidatus Dojkabacteria bacterium]|nr:MAG: hypothetical protein KatS3mg085_705 [Candidatus Dojkabacteria bacterium]
MNIQTIFLVGRATKDLEIQDSKNGNKYVRFSLAVNDYDKSAEKEEVTYYDVLLFGQQAENASERIKKGDAVLVVGKPEIDAYASKNEGEPKAKVSVIAKYWQALK